MKKSSLGIYAFILAVIITLELILSAAYIAAEAQHDCPGEDCAV